MFSDRRPDKSNTNKPPPLSDSRVQHQHTELLFITSTASCDVCFKTHCYIIAYNLLNLTVIPQAVVSRGHGSLLSEHFTFFKKKIVQYFISICSVEGVVKTVMMSDLRLQTTEEIESPKQTLCCYAHRSAFPTEILFFLCITLHLHYTMYFCMFSFYFKFIF